jgi:HD superfamily phosphohydrolase
LQLPRQAINTIEQIIICKFMLFSYIYHHKKVRAAEGMLARLIRRRVAKWRDEGMDDSALICQFLKMTDHSLDGDIFDLSAPDISEYRERVVNRVLPRAVVGFTANVDHPESDKLGFFMSNLLDKQKTQGLVDKFEAALATELKAITQHPDESPESVLTAAGAWFDAPKAPAFNKLEELLIEGTKITEVFPITSWIQAYISYRYHARVFAFSEHVDEVEKAVRRACKQVLGIEDPQFIDLMRIERD